MADATYTVIVRVPISRGDFVDPPEVSWDASKDEALWKVLSSAAQAEIDWHQVAEHFEVPVEFLLHQVAYMTEQHASKVREQVRRATAAAKGSAAPSPIPGAEQPRAASALSARRESPLPPRGEASRAATPLVTSGRPGVSRNTSTGTAMRRDGSGSSTRPAGSGQAKEPLERTRLSSLPAVLSSGQQADTAIAEADRRQSLSPGLADSSSSKSESDEETYSLAQSHVVRRAPRFQQRDAQSSYSIDVGDDDDESEPAFQPPPSSSESRDLSTTVTDQHRPITTRAHQRFSNSPNTLSRANEAPTAAQRLDAQTPESRFTGPLSPRRTAELSGRSPGGKAKVLSREGSEGTPSMGSSFSDLDDALITQSALEEALASHMNRGGASSRFSISGAFRSRYHPNSSR